MSGRIADSDPKTSPTTMIADRETIRAAATTIGTGGEVEGHASADRDRDGEQSSSFFLGEEMPSSFSLFDFTIISIIVIIA
mmetsp:Transcript_15057/g.42500  ORF Transcript_15057/g.42500 Transcript_15057/m.42500 type:complete len:81 (+) Transcript_15057:980-1222(+)